MVCSHLGRLGLIVFLALGASTSAIRPARADLYMSAGSSVYRFDDQSGVLLSSKVVDHSTEGLKIGPDGRLYVGVGFGANRVDTLNADLSGSPANFITEGQGGLFTPGG